MEENMVVEKNNDVYRISVNEWREKAKMVTPHRKWSSGSVIRSGKSFWQYLQGNTSKP